MGDIDMSTKSRIIIIGAGPTGLGAGWRLTELGYTNFVIYEKNTYVGGLATSFVDDKGFTWDIGGHVLHSHYPYFDRMFETVMKGDYFTHQRESWVWMLDRFVPFPFQNNIHRLPEHALRECMDGLKAISKQKITPKNFAEWIRASYGEGIAKHFLIPYNRKVWAYPLTQMSYQWVGDRVAPVDVARIEQNIKEKRDDVSWGPNAVFRYPKRGGTGDIWNRVAKRFSANIQLQKELVFLDTKKKQVRFADGSKDSYDLLFSTMPLDFLVPDVQTKLHRSAVTVVGVGLRGHVPEHLKTKCWMYFPGSEPYFRATVLSNYSPHNAPIGTWSLMFEIASSITTPLVKDAIEQTLQSSLIPKGAKIVNVWTMTSEYGYPTPTIDRDQVVDPILLKLEKQDIYSRGRFGMWKYEVSNQDHTFMQGVEWANSFEMSQRMSANTLSETVCLRMQTRK